VRDPKGVIEMALASPYEVGYKPGALKRAWRRSLVRPLLLILFALGICGFGAYQLANYVANFPRERSHATLTFFERLKLGSERAFSGIFAALTAPDFGRNETSLPLVEIYISGQYVDALNSNLPDSGRIFQKALVKLREEGEESDKVFKAKVRYRGDSINHWAMPQKSWRIELTKDKLFQGRDTFNLYLPRTSSQVADYIGYEMGERLGLLSPRAYPVHFRLNRRFDGTRVFLEQVDQSFLSSRFLDPWYIYIGDITTNQIYGLEERKPLFHNPEVWEFSAPDMDRGTADSDMGERKILHHLSSVLNRDRSAYEFVQQISQVLDIEATLRYIALLDIVGSGHVDDTHNHKWYLNPRTGVLSPVVWDTAAYMWGNSRKLSRPSNLLFKRILQIPEFHARKNKIMWEAVNGPLGTKLLQQYVREEAQKIKPDVYADPFKQTALHTKIDFLSNSGWEAGVKELLSVIEERNNTVIRDLKNSALEVRVSGDRRSRTLTVVPSGNAGLIGREVVVALTGANAQTKVSLERESLDVFSRKVKADPVQGVVEADKQLVRFTFSDQWYPWSTPQRIVKDATGPASYRYVIKLDGDGDLGDVTAATAESAITSEAVVARIVSENIQSVVVANGWWQPEQFVEKEEVVLEGAVALTKDLELDHYQDLVIKPGTTIKMAPHVSILLRGGSLRAVGTADKPIVIESAEANEPWGVIALQGINREKAPESFIAHAVIRGGSYAYRSYAYYEAALNVHYALLHLQDVVFDRSRVAAKDAEIELDNVKFMSRYKEPIIAVNSRVQRRHVNIEQIPLVHPVGSQEVDGAGTPPRHEREFRYGIYAAATGGGIDAVGLNSDQLAALIHTALKGGVSQTKRWSAPLITGTSYRVSDAVDTSVYRDIYIDSPDGVNYRNNISYRLRNRFKSLSVHKRHVKDPLHPGFWPYRSEFQAKTGRENPETGLTVVEEARFEFRQQSKPFGPEFPPPPPPWRLADLLPQFVVGTFFGEVTTPGRLAADYLKSVLPAGHPPLLYAPRAVVVTERRRQHLEIKTPWGTGPNPDQSFIITLDNSAIFDSGEYLRAVDQGEQGMKPDLPLEKGHLFELEMEFERNVSEGVVNALKAARSAGDSEEVKRLQQVQNAFIKDQEQIVAVIKEELASLGLAFEPVHKSKFVQSVDQLTHGSHKTTLGHSVTSSGIGRTQK
jgi:CotH kinase protein